MTIAIETRPFGFTTAAQQFGLMASRALDPTPVFEEILREFPQVASQAFGGSPDLIDTGQMHGAWMAPMHSFSADVLSIGVDEEHSHFWWMELLAPFEAVAESWADMFAAYVLAGAPGATVVQLVGV